MPFHYKRFKSILSAKNAMNIYRGCTHGCIYCDSRSHCYQFTHEFTDIEVKQDAPEQLRGELASRRKRCMISTGSMTDSYMPLEAELEYMRRCLEVIEAAGFGVTLLTKSDLILRDLDVLRSINAKARCVVQTTLTTLDEELCRVLEPNVCTTRTRFEMLKTMREAGIPTVVWICPLLPFINDTEKNLRGLLDMCVEAGVHGIFNFGMGVTLREGNREYFYERLDAHFPGMKEQYHRSFGEAYMIPSPNAPRLQRLFDDTCTRHSILTGPERIFEYLAEFNNKTAVQDELF